MQLWIQHGLILEDGCRNQFEPFDLPPNLPSDPPSDSPFPF